MNVYERFIGRAMTELPPAKEPAEMEASHIPEGAVAGYIVLTETHGKWKDDWDGEVHATLRDGYVALKEARSACCDAILVQCVRAPEEGHRFGESLQRRTRSRLDNSWR